jgi:hypothetical protein
MRCFDDDDDDDEKSFRSWGIENRLSVRYLLSMISDIKNATIAIHEQRYSLSPHLRAHSPIPSSTPQKQQPHSVP